MIQEGDVVVLKGSNGPKMTVTVTPYREGANGTPLNTTIKTMWFDNENHLHHGEFKCGLLEQVTYSANSGFWSTVSGYNMRILK